MCLPPCENGVAVNCHFGDGLICDITGEDTFTDICNKVCDPELISKGDSCKCGDIVGCGATEDSYCVGTECKTACAESILAKECYCLAPKIVCGADFKCDIDKCLPRCSDGTL